MNQRLRDGALIAEVVSGIAVIFTLVFLIQEIRENTNVVRSAAYERSIDSLNEWRIVIASDEDLARLMAERLSSDLLDEFGPEEGPVYMRKRLLSLVQWSIYEKTYYSRNYDLLGASEWSRFEKVICNIAQTPSSRWSRDIERFLTLEFAEYVVESCKLDA